MRPQKALTAAEESAAARAAEEAGRLTREGEEARQKAQAEQQAAEEAAGKYSKAKFGFPNLAASRACVSCALQYALTPARLLRLQQWPRGQGKL